VKVLWAMARSHRLIIIVSGNRAVLNAWEPLAPLIEAIPGIADANCLDLPVAVDGHHAMTRALEQHDADAAEALLHEHLVGGERLVHNAIRSVRNRGA
jgi:DNA-binding GntR family transcriptional regulator